MTHKPENLYTLLPEVPLQYNMSSNLVSDGGQPFEQGRDRDAALNGRHHSKSHGVGNSGSVENTGGHPYAGETESSRDDPAHTGGRRYAGGIDRSIDDPAQTGGKAIVPRGGQRDINDSEQVPSESQDKAGAIDRDGRIIQASPAEPRELFSYLVYKSNPLVRVFAGRTTMYRYPGDEYLYAILSRTLECIRWVPIVSWNNNTAAAQQYQVSYTTGLKITEGSEVSIGFNLGASYEGFSMGIDYSHKTFKSTETTSSKTITLTVNVPPFSQVIFYQKSYEFSDYVTFVLDAWGQEWNVGPWGGYTPLTHMDVFSTIMAEEYFTNNAPLPAGPGTMQVTSVGPPTRAGTTRKRENCTERCKNLLARMGAK